MNLGLISLICLLAAIVIGFVKNCNVGILCTGIAGIRHQGVRYHQGIQCLPVHPDGRHYLSVCNY